MNKIIAFSILGMGLTGAMLIISVAFLFNPPIGNTLKIILAGATTSFIIFAISAIVLRRRLEAQSG